MIESTIQNPKVVTRAEWLVARKAHLAKEKALTHAYDELRKERLELPWVKVDKEYAFDGPQGKVKLADLFEGRSQLIIYHFMFGPGWNEGCVGCSFGADHMNAAVPHLEHHDVTYVAVSRAPLPEIDAFKRRMGWNFKWVSSFGSDFNYDYHVSFTKEDLDRGNVYYNYAMGQAQGEESSGTSVFYKDAAGDIFHTYSCYARGGEKILGAYMLLDMTPKGRNENGPNYSLADWVRHHDLYDARGFVNTIGRYVPAKLPESA